MKIKSKEEALKFVDTEVRNIWKRALTDSAVGDATGEAKILEEQTVQGHKAWQYHITDLPLSRDARKRWVLDNSELVETTINPDESTIELAYRKRYGRELTNSEEGSA